MKDVMNKVNEVLDSPWTLRRSFKWSGICLVLMGISYVWLFWDGICEWYENLKDEHWKKSWGDAWVERSNEED